MERTVIKSPGKWAEAAGGSMAVKVGNTIEICGMIAVDPNGRLIGENSPYEQTKAVLKKLEKVLQETGSSLKDVVRTHLYVTDISAWKEYAKAHKEFFSDITPCTTIVEVKRLIMPEYIIAIDATAILS